MAGVVEAAEILSASILAGTSTSKNTPVLAAGGAMEVDDNLQSVVARPGDSLLEIGQLTGAVRLAGANFERPISDWDTDVVQSNSG